MAEIESIENGVIVIQQNRQLHTGGVIFRFIGGLTIYAMIFPVSFADISMQIYQSIFFTAFDIPKVRRKDYVVMDRSKLRSLTWLQKLNCIYCEYANGVIAWAKAVAAQTEIYTCAIKHKTPVKGQDHQNGFYEYNKFL